LRYAEEAQMEIDERPFSVEEVKSADEAFITSASAFVMPVVEMDGTSIGGGRPGGVSKRLREIYIEESRKRAI
jgi:D-alanine transaminase